MRIFYRGTSTTVSTWTLQMPSRDRGPDENAGGAKQLCTVKSDLTGIADSDLVMKRQGKRFFRKGKKYYLCNFEVRAIVAPADLRFELWFGDHKFSGNHEPVRVTWDSEGAQVGS